MKTARFLREINALSAAGAETGFFYGLHPLAKLLVTVSFVVTLMSMDKYAFIPVLAMGSYSFLAFVMSGLSFKNCLTRIYPVLLMAGFVGLANPFLDKQVINIGQWQLGAGYVSFATLMLKGFWAVLASYVLIATSSVASLCYALRLLHVPKILVTQFLLTYRYLMLLVQEVENVSAAYALRAPRQKGLNFKVWGSLVGHMLLRSMDRAENIYASMVMRGFRGEIYYNSSGAVWNLRDWLFLLTSAAGFWLLRYCL